MSLVSSGLRPQKKKKNPTNICIKEGTLKSLCYRTTFPPPRGEASSAGTILNSYMSRYLVHLHHTAVPKKRHKIRHRVSDYAGDG